jgi:Gas vesicle synthesis protein GvpL/GvpF
MATRVKRGRSGGNGLEQPDQVLYVYAMTRGASKLVTKLPGVDGAATVESLTIGDYSCWISRVSKTEFADELQQNMQNLDWLAAAGVRHQQIVSAIAELGDLLPARFATVFLTEASLRKYVQQHRQEFEASFARIKGCDEWGIKIHALRRAPAPQPVGDETGRQYLQRKSATIQARTSRIDADVEQIARALDAISRESTPGGSVSQGQPGLLWQRSFLIPRKNRKQLEALLAKFAERWRETRSVECTGPWPPYSFVSAGGEQSVGSQAESLR